MHVLYKYKGFNHDVDKDKEKDCLAVVGLARLYDIVPFIKGYQAKETEKGGGQGSESSRIRFGVDCSGNQAKDNCGFGVKVCDQSNISPLIGTYKTQSRPG